MLHKMRDEKPLVSVIVPTYNSMKTLEHCLKSVKNQNYKNVELIVVDRYSKDHTCQIAKEFGAAVLFKGPERSSQKNWGAANAKGELLYFVDSDFILEPNVVSKCVDACEYFDATTTVNYSVGRGLWGKSIALQERFLAHDPTIQTARFVRKSVFFKVGGFDESLVIGEDLDFYARLSEGGFRIGNVDAIEWHVGEPETLRDIARRNFYYGKVVKAYLAKRKGFAVRQLGPFKLTVLWMLIKNGNPYLFSLAVVNITRWVSSLFGLICSR